jgi:hypothetical protein
MRARSKQLLNADHVFPHDGFWKRFSVSQYACRTYVILVVHCVETPTPCSALADVHM